MVLLPQFPNLFRAQACHIEHANLKNQSATSDQASGTSETYVAEYVIPRPRRATLPKPFH